MAIVLKAAGVFPSAWTKPSLYTRFRATARCPGFANAVPKAGRSTGPKLAPSRAGWSHLAEILYPQYRHDLQASVTQLAGDPQPRRRVDPPLPLRQAARVWSSYTLRCSA